MRRTNKMYKNPTFLQLMKQLQRDYYFHQKTLLWYYYYHHAMCICIPKGTDLLSFYSKERDRCYAPYCSIIPKKCNLLLLRVRVKK